MKTAEQESKFKNLGEVITQLSPQAKDLLNAKQMQIEKLTRDVEIANKQLNTLKSVIQAEGQADNIPHLPR